jgi:hypothetical protein
MTGPSAAPGTTGVPVSTTGADVADETGVLVVEVPVVVLMGDLTGRGGERGRWWMNGWTRRWTTVILGCQ